MATLQVLSAGAVKPALATIAPAFEAAEGIAIDATFGPAPELRERTKRGTGDFGVVIGPESLIVALAGEGKLVDESRRPLGGVKAAVALHRDARVPDLSTPDAVAAAVRAASAIVYNTASSGQYIDAMIKGLGIAEEVEPRVRRFPNAEDAMRFLGSDAGRDAIGFGQSSAIRGYEKPLGVRQVAALPDAIGNVTRYEAALATTAPDAAAAAAFIDFLVGPEGRRHLAATGVE
ncbi:MAG: substrate-binding domain-containing protein [Alphaproteobacteria bacterium]